jgi:hypothetical protein
MVLLIGGGVVKYFVLRPWWDRPTAREREGAVAVLAFNAGLEAESGGYRVMRVGHSGVWTDRSWWYLFEASPGDVDACEAAVRRRDGGRVEEVGLSGVCFPDQAERPWWWRPETLADAKVLHVRGSGTGEGEGWFIVSRGAGRIYFHPWSL